jgi:hypothetical protein
MAEWLLSKGGRKPDELAKLREEADLEVEQSLEIVLSEIRAAGLEVER